MKNILSKIKKTASSLALSSIITFGGCKREGEKSIKKFLGIKNPGETEFIEYKKTITFDYNDFGKGNSYGIYPLVSYDLDTGKKLIFNDEFYKKIDSNKNIKNLGDIKKYLIEEGYEFSTWPHGGGIREVIYPDYLTRDFTFFGKEYLIFDEKKNLSIEKLLEDLPYTTYQDIKETLDQLNSEKRKRNYLAFIKTDKNDYYVLRELSWSKQPPKVEIEAYKIKNSKVPMYSSKLPMH